MAMMVALSSAVSGLKSEQSALDVIANNIANVNTTGYKAQAVTFSDLLSQTISSSSGASGSTGSVNAQQVGLGTQVSATTTDLTVGSTSTTSNALDVALSGAGYLMVATGTAGVYEYTRAGNLTIDDTGNLNVGGNKICGWQTKATASDGTTSDSINTQINPVSINLYTDSTSKSLRQVAAIATTKATVTGTLDSSVTAASTALGLKNIGTIPTTWDATTSINVINAKGTTTAVTVNMKKCATVNSTTSWYWQASATDATISPSSGYIAFDEKNGKLISDTTSVTSLTVSNSEQGDLAAAVSNYGDSTITADYTAYKEALTGGVAATIASTKATLDTAIGGLTASTATTSLQAALAKYNTAGGKGIAADATALNTDIKDGASVSALAVLKDAVDAAVKAESDTPGTCGGAVDVQNAYKAYAAAITSGVAADIVSTKDKLNIAIKKCTSTTASPNPVDTLTTARDDYDKTSFTSPTTGTMADIYTNATDLVDKITTATAAGDKTPQDTLGLAITTAINVNASTALKQAYTAYTEALSADDASKIVSTKVALDSAISIYDTANSTTALTNALTIYNNAVGTAINTTAIAARDAGGTKLATAITSGVTETQSGSTFQLAISGISDKAFQTAFGEYATAITDAATAITNGSTPDSAAIVSTKTALDKAVSTYVAANPTSSLATDLITYNTTIGTQLDVAAKLSVALTAATTKSTTGYTDSSLSVSSLSTTNAGTTNAVTTGITPGKYAVTVSASTTSTGYNITLTDETNNKTYTTTSTDGSATFKTTTGTITLAAPTTLKAGTVEYTVSAGTPITFGSTPSLIVTATGGEAVSVNMSLEGIIMSNLSSSTTTASSTSSTLSNTTDGYVTGTAQSYSISSDGTISCTYSNGNKVALGQISLAMFKNAGGLEKTGGNLYTETISSGGEKAVVAGTGGSGTITSYALELSNVDLASQFSAMMISQRAYQANSKVITTSDTMLQSLINMVG